MILFQTLQLAYSGKTNVLFYHERKQYQVIGQMDRPDRDEPLDLKAKCQKPERRDDSAG